MQGDWAKSRPFVRLTRLGDIQVPHTSGGLRSSAEPTTVRSGSDSGDSPRQPPPTRELPAGPLGLPLPDPGGRTLAQSLPGHAPRAPGVGNRKRVLVGARQTACRPVSFAPGRVLCAPY
jgi:hypothetical protein